MSHRSATPASTPQADLKGLSASTAPVWREELRRLSPLFILLGAILLIAPLGMMGDIVLERRVTLALVNLVAVVGLYIFMGNSGILTFSAVGFMAIGAYVSALTTLNPMLKQTFLPNLPDWLNALQISPLAGTLAAGCVAAAVAAVVGWPLMRLSGIAAAIATLSLLIIAYIGLGNWTSVTGGQTSLMGLNTWVKLWPAAIWACVAVTIAFVYQETRWALALRATREDEVAARASALLPVPLRLIAFVISAFVSGMAGALYGHFLGTLRVETFYLDSTFLFLTMLVVGGQRSLTGAVVGTFAISLLAELLRLLEVGIPMGPVALSAPAGLGDVVLAGVMLAILVFRPQGITGGREVIWPRRHAPTPKQKEETQ
ncbi:MAG: branched-chain amino acid ABC transporter permease [Pseudomonadota bacterium]